MKEFFLVVIALFGILYGIAKAKLAKAQKTAEDAQKNAARAEAEKDIISSSASVYEAMVKKLDAVDSSKEEPVPEKPSIAVPAEALCDTPEADAGTASYEVPEIEISITAQEQSKEMIKRLRKLRGL